MPPDFVPPAGFDHSEFVLRPLGVEHNEGDYEAWTTSVDHIRRTPGNVGRSWPSPMSLEENARALEGHVEDFTLRRGFTYTVLTPDETELIGCVYIYPGSQDGVDIRSWVRASRAELDVELYEAVLRWLEAEWPFRTVDYANRG